MGGVVGGACWAWVRVFWWGGVGAGDEGEWRMEVGR